jgi:hypothetical protein
MRRRTQEEMDALIRARKIEMEIDRRGIFADSLTEMMV